MNKTAIIIGAGPAGLTAGYELLTRTDIRVVIIEKTAHIGGISKTVNYKGNRIDIGGHRFFSKSAIVMKWWQNVLPLQGFESKDDILKRIHYQNYKTSTKLSEDGPDPEKSDRVMLIRVRFSRIFHLRRFFDYPVSLSIGTIYNLGLIRIVRIGFSYLWIKLFPVKNITTLEDFFISRFGNELYRTFFKDYTEKVWGVPCSKIDAGWGSQRIKELSVRKALIHAISSVFKGVNSIEQKNIETSLITQFMYPKFGPGQMWETVADMIEANGGKIIKNSEVIEIKTENNKVTELTILDQTTRQHNKIKGDYFFSSMPVKDLIRAMGNSVLPSVKTVSEGLLYRDFITVGLLLDKLKIKNETKVFSLKELVPDCWIYIQEKDVKVGRIQIFNNWSPYMVSDFEKVWIGLEYFCNEGDELWCLTDQKFIEFAVNELDNLAIIDKRDVLDSTIIRSPKTYPAYFGTYNEFNVIREYTDQFENLFLVGRNGMHRYNNQDHSMLTSMTAVNNIIEGKVTKENIWNINTEEEYHESVK